MLPPKPKQEPEAAAAGDFIFVGGPKLQRQSGKVRSTFLRRAIPLGRKKTRQDATDQLEIALKKSGKKSDELGLCSCASSLMEQMGASTFNAESLESETHRMILPKLWNQRDGRLSGRCATCGGDLWPVSGSAAGVEGALLRARSQSRSSSPEALLLGAARGDPLLPLNTTTAKLKVHELLDFAATVIWPHFRGTDHATNCYQQWIFPLENNLQLYAILWAASYHRDILRVTYGVPCQESNQQLYLKSLALQALQGELDNTSKWTNPDRLVMCILWLAANDKHKKIVRDSSPFSPPLTDLQALDFCGGQEYHPLHWHMVQDIIRRIGGIESLRTYALSWMVSLSSLMTAAQFISKPIYPVMSVLGYRLILQPPALLFKPHGYYDKDCSSCPAGSGFDELSFLRPPVKQNLILAFKHLGEYSTVLQFFQGDDSTNSSSSICSPMVRDLIGDSRNLVHHRLLSLPDENHPVDDILALAEAIPDSKPYPPPNLNQLSSDIYLACRLSAILYAIHVTFPLPRSSSVRKTLLESLTPRLEDLCARGISSTLLAWCLVVVISTMGKRAPQTLVGYAGRLCRELGVDGVEKLSDLLKAFAWVNAAVKDDWKGMWAVILAERSHE
ncbi:hypothetical protein BJY01DRAFT_138862 [Aspergillus pseudoustus]|uniref:Fungal-specific transcription factor domain-containing protein n=1 Tax=Aspergillus pseudoustus TaxID=1810923 RepID=A0ABR4KCB5_9EURO